jgi:hypothetical protein
LVLRIHDEAQSWCVAGNKQLRGLLALLWKRELLFLVCCGRKSGCNVILGCVRGWVEGFSNLGVTVPSCVYFGAPTLFCLMKNASRRDHKKKVW